MIPFNGLPVGRCPLILRLDLDFVEHLQKRLSRPSAPIRQSRYPEVLELKRAPRRQHHRDADRQLLPVYELQSESTLSGYKSKIYGKLTMKTNRGTPRNVRFRGRCSRNLIERRIGRLGISILASPRSVDVGDGALENHVDARSTALQRSHGKTDLFDPRHRVDDG
jgi:hypothetical protein